LTVVHRWCARVRAQSGTNWHAQGCARRGADRKWPRRLQGPAAV